MRMAAPWSMECDSRKERKKSPVTGSGAAQSLRPVSAGRHPVAPARSAFHFGCVLTRQASRSRAGPRATSPHRSGPRSCTSRQAVDAAGSWRCGEGTPEMAKPLAEPINGHGVPRGRLLSKEPRQHPRTPPRGAIAAEKTKRPGTLRCPGLWRESLGGHAPMRNLHPVAVDPRMRQCAFSRFSANTWRAVDPGSARATTGRGLRTTRRARAHGPRRVECW